MYRQIAGILTAAKKAYASNGEEDTYSELANKISRDCDIVESMSPDSNTSSAVDVTSAASVLEYGCAISTLKNSLVSIDEYLTSKSENDDKTRSIFGELYGTLCTMLDRVHVQFARLHSTPQSSDGPESGMSIESELAELISLYSPGAESDFVLGMVSDILGAKSTPNSHKLARAVDGKIKSLLHIDRDVPSLPLSAPAPTLMDRMIPFVGNNVLPPSGFLAESEISSSLFPGIKTGDTIAKYLAQNGTRIAGSADCTDGCVMILMSYIGNESTYNINIRGLIDRNYIQKNDLTMTPITGLCKKHIEKYDIMNDDVFCSTTDIDRAPEAVSGSAQLWALPISLCGFAIGGSKFSVYYSQNAKLLVIETYDECAFRLMKYTGNSRFTLHSLYDINPEVTALNCLTESAILDRCMDPLFMIKSEAYSNAKSRPSGTLKLKIIENVCSKFDDLFAERGSLGPSAFSDVEPISSVGGYHFRAKKRRVQYKKRGGRGKGTSNTELIGSQPTVSAPKLSNADATPSPSLSPSPSSRIIHGKDVYTIISNQDNYAPTISRIMEDELPSNLDKTDIEVIVTFASKFANLLRIIVTTVERRFSEAIGRVELTETKFTVTQCSKLFKEVLSESLDEVDTAGDLSDYAISRKLF